MHFSAELTIKYKEVVASNVKTVDEISFSIKIVKANFCFRRSYFYLRYTYSLKSDLLFLKKIICKTGNKLFPKKLRLLIPAWRNKSNELPIYPSVIYQ